MLVIQSEAKRTAAPASFGNSLEMQSLRPHCRPLNQDLHFTNIP